MHSTRKEGLGHSRNHVPNHTFYTTNCITLDRASSMTLLVDLLLLVYSLLIS